MSVLFIVLIIIIAAAVTAIVFFAKKKPYPSAPVRSNADAVPEEEYIPVEIYGLYCCIRKGEDGLVTNNVFRFSDNAGKDDNGAVLSAVIGQRKPEDGYFPKEKWFNWDWNYENEDRPGGRWKRSGNCSVRCPEPISSVRPISTVPATTSTGRPLSSTAPWRTASSICPRTAI